MRGSPWIQTGSPLTAAAIRAPSSASRARTSMSSVCSRASRVSRRLASRSSPINVSNSAISWVRRACSSGRSANTHHAGESMMVKSKYQDLLYRVESFGRIDRNAGLGAPRPRRHCGNAWHRLSGGDGLLADRKNKAFLPHHPGSTPRGTVASGVPRSQAERGAVRPGQAPQEGGGASLRGALGRRSREGWLWKAGGTSLTRRRTHSMRRSPDP